MAHYIWPKRNNIKMRFFQTLSSEYISMGLINIKSRWRLLYVACRSHFRHTQYCLGGNSTWWACGMLICYLCHHHYHYWGFLKQKNTKSSRLLVWSTKKSPLLFRESTSIFRERVVAFFSPSDFSLGFVLISREWRGHSHLEISHYRGVTNKVFETQESNAGIVVA